MANPFSKMQEYFSAPHRVTHDCSFVNNLTMDFGTLVPVFYKDVVPGESFRITPTFRMNFQPMIFPVQTNMRAHLHFFYCRTKDVYKDWLDKFGMTKEGLEMPYMKLTPENRDMVETGKLGDYLGLPTVTYGEYGNYKEDDISAYGYDFTTGEYKTNQWLEAVTAPAVGESLFSGIYNSSYSRSVRVAVTVPISALEGFDRNHNLILHLRGDVSFVSPEVNVYAADINGYRVSNMISHSNLQIGPETYNKIDFGTVSDESIRYLVLVFSAYNFPGTESGTQNGSTVTNSGTLFAQNANFFVQFQVDSQYGLENSSMDLAELPFYSDDNPEGERLVNLPFRFYEFIYNSFYRDERNNPYKIDGQVEYNKYLPSTEGGEDTYHYQLRRANWEQDFLTTATSSPQFGVAPLVGVTATGTMTFQDEDGNTYTAVAKTGDDNDTITGIEVHSPDMPVGTLRALIDTVSSGISISDFRNVNALQRLLEKRLRHGLKYVDMVQASYGTRPKNLEISMPEFIGGVNEDVIVNRISQTVDTEAVPLGTVGGQAGVLGTSNHPISCYCDDFGCIMGIMYIAPVPNYSQLLPKYWLKSEALDFYHPEFSHIGYQPILNKEVAPLQFFRDDKANGTDNYNSVFGYQRPWYDYISSVDEVHGNFRNNMRRYLINRVFDTPPALTEDFLLVDSKQVNDVFAVTEDSDKIFGEILFRVKRKNAVPTLSIPRLES